MRKNTVALAGASGLLVLTAVLTPAVASAAPVAAVATGHDYIAMLAPVAVNKVTGSGEAWLTLDGTSAKFTVQVSGLLNGAPHAAHIYLGGKGTCPTGTAGQALTLADATPALGTAAASLTNTGDTSSAAAWAHDQYPTPSDYTYSRTFDVTPAVAAAVADGTAVFVVNGIDYNGNGKYDTSLGTTAGDSSVSAEESAPALCGGFVPSQMETIPTGSADTGGGSAAASSHPMQIGLGALALTAAAGFGLLARRRRVAGAAEDVITTGGFRRRR